jgi:predicted nuclease of restriction endonuclease-like (RecB) superfamily
MAATASPPPADYGHVLSDLRLQVRTAQTKAKRAVNAEMLQLYRTIGAALLERVHGDRTAEVVRRLGADLRHQFPDMAALTPENLNYMRRFAQAWPEPANVPELDALPWGHIRVLLDNVDDPQTRDEYAAAAAKHGWSEEVLLHQIRSRTQPGD